MDCVEIGRCVGAHLSLSQSAQTNFYDPTCTLLHFEGTLCLMQNIRHLKWGREDNVEGTANQRCTNSLTCAKACMQVQNI